MPRHRQKPCDRCQSLADTLYRVKYDSLNQWQLVCQTCWRIVSQSDRYRYGGTWKATKR